MIICSYVIKKDTGLAPNPFHGYCTMALCTPSHGRAKVEVGDWIVGNSEKPDGNRLVYAMCISQRLTMDQYFRDDRFRLKKPKPDGTVEEQCGDNIYYQSNGNWKRLPSRFHNDCDAFSKDVGKDFQGRPVFVADKFYYFGRNRKHVPSHLQGIIFGGRNFHYVDDDRLVEDFLTWLMANHEPGILGTPRHMEDRSREKGKMLTDWTTDCRWKPKDGRRSECLPQLQSYESEPRNRGCR